MNHVASDIESKIRISFTEICLTALFVGLATAFAISVTMKPESAEALYESQSIDSLVFRAAGEILRDGKSPYSIQNQVESIAARELNGNTPSFAIPFAYPPNSLPLFRLRALGQPELNAAVFMGTTVLCSLLSLTLICLRYLKRASARLLVTFVAAFWTPGLLGINLGQTGHFVALVAFAFLLQHDRRPILAGILLGILACKPQYALPLGLVSLIRMNWRVLISAASTFVLMSLFSALLYGWSMWGEFWHSATEMNPTIYWMKSWPGVASLTFPDHVDLISKAAIPLYLLAMLLLSGLLIVLREKLDLLGMCSLAILITLVTSPNTHIYDMGLAFIPAIYITRQIGMISWPPVIVFLVYLLPNSVLTVLMAAILSGTQLCLLLLCLVLLVCSNVQKEHPNLTN